MGRPAKDDSEGLSEIMHFRATKQVRKQFEKTGMDNIYQY